LSGTNRKAYSDCLWPDGGHYIDAPKLIQTYRRQVNPNVLVYLVPVVGYADTIVPETYRGTFIRGGWGDGLLRYAHAMTQNFQPRVNPRRTSGAPETHHKAGTNCSFTLSSLNSSDRHWHTSKRSAIGGMALFYWDDLEYAHDRHVRTRGWWAVQGCSVERVGCLEGDIQDGPEQEVIRAVLVSAVRLEGVGGLGFVLEAQSVL
jgi:hypothetical protein